MSRKQRLNAREKNDLLKALQAAQAAVKKTQQNIAIYSDIYDAASYALANLDGLVEAVTGDRGNQRRMPYRN